MTVAICLLTDNYYFQESCKIIADNRPSSSRAETLYDNHEMTQPRMIKVSFYDHQDFRMTKNLGINLNCSNVQAVSLRYFTTTFSGDFYIILPHSLLISHILTLFS